MHVFVLEDFSTPTVRIEYSAKAGIGMQDADNTGFFPLYAKLFPKAGIYSNKSRASYLEKLHGECNADSSRFIITASSAETENIFAELAACAFAPIFPDAELSKELADAKKQIQETAFTVDGFINASIDSRIFYKAPWKHDSGIYPALFNGAGNSKVRAIFSEISERFYSPQNSALFISGGIRASRALDLAEKTFGQYAPHAQTAAQKNLDKEQLSLSGTNNSSKKFVLSDNELSSEITQIVIEYTGLSMEQADIAAVLLNQNDSAVKQQLSGQKSLGIRDSEYIHFDAAHKNGSSRLIIQSIMEKSKSGICDKSILFEKILLEQIPQFSEDDFLRAKYFLVRAFYHSLENSSAFMDLLSQFWATDGISDDKKLRSGLPGDSESLIQRFINHDAIILQENYDDLVFALQQENPFIFVLTNSKTYNSEKKKFDDAKYESITFKNGSWYTQELYAQFRKLIENSADEETEKSSAQAVFYDEYFAGQTENSFSKKILSNGIPLFMKKIPSTPEATVSLYIKGGEFSSPKNRYGLETVTAGLLAQNLEKTSQNYLEDGRLSDFPEINFEGTPLSTIVSAKSFSDDAERLIEIFGESLIFSDIIPSEADSIIYGKKSSHIIKTGSPVYQLFCAGIKRLYNSDYEKIYSSNQEILKNVKYEEILEAYTALLNAGRLTIIVTGNFDEEKISDKAENVFAALSGKYDNKIKCAQAKFPSRTNYKIKLQHLFLTDVSKEKAGPRPAVLIPTTDFSDPVQFFIQSPENNKAAFDASLLYLKEKLLKKINSDERYKGMSVQIKEKEVPVNFGILTFINVKHTELTDGLFEDAILQIKEELKADGEKASFEIKTLWASQYFEDASSNYGMTLFIRNSIDQTRADAEFNQTDFSVSDFNAENLLYDYKKISECAAEDFINIFEEYFENGQILKLYSADSKR